MKKRISKDENARNDKQHMKRLQRGFGTIRYLGPGRKNAYAVHPPRKRNEDGSGIRPKALCYVSDWYVGFAVLAAWHAGAYTPGMEDTILERLHKRTENKEPGIEERLRDTIPQTQEELYTYCRLLQEYVCSMGKEAKKTGRVRRNKRTVVQNESLTIKRSL